MIEQSIEEMAASKRRLPQQLWIDHNESGKPTPERLVNPPRTRPSGVPHGGLWTSTLTEGVSSAWRDHLIRTTRGIHPIVRRRAWILTPAPARVWEIRDRNAHLDLLHLAPVDELAEIWPAVAQTFDAVHMTQNAATRSFFHTERPEGEAGLRRAKMLFALAQGGSVGPLDRWDAESTMWFGWHFESVEEAGWIDVPRIPHDVT